MYECLEQPSLATWQLAEEVDVASLQSTSAPRSIAPTVTLATPTQPGATLDAASVSLAAHAVQQQQQQNQLPSRPGLGYREVCQSIMPVSSDPASVNRSCRCGGLQSYHGPPLPSERKRTMA